MTSWYSYLSNVYTENNDDLDHTDLESVTAGPLDFPLHVKKFEKVYLN